MADNNLFRKEALDKVSNPEQLDQHVRITRPGAWVAILAIVTLFVGVGIWAFVGNIYSGENVYGVIFPTNSLIVKTSQSGGKITDVLVSETQEVEKGDVLAVVPDSNLLSQIAEKQAAYMSATGPAKETLKLALESLKAQYLENSFITAEKSGTISEIESIDTVIEPGSTVAMNVSNESTSNSKEIIAYVSYSIASTFKVGDVAQVTPASLKREEYGYMTGTVTKIGSSVISEDDIIKSMGTTKYVASMDLAPDSVEVRVRINVDNTSKNGYEWSNSRGKNIEKIDIGTLCNIKVITNNKRPIDLLIG